MHHRLAAGLTLALASGCSLVGPVPEPVDGGPGGHGVELAAVARIASTAAGAAPMGSVGFSRDGAQVTVQVRLKGLAPGMHGLHIHLNSSCAADAMGTPAGAAGGHWNPTRRPHGAAGGGHLGDLGNITADAAGDATASLLLPGVTLGTGHPATDILGHALVVHAGPDDLMTNPAGNSGGRIGCGVISDSVDACPPGAAGESCELCESPLVKGRDGACHRPCTQQHTACDANPNTSCDEVSPGALACLCMPGHRAPSCATCAPGYGVDEKGRCVMATPPPGTTLLGIAGYGSLLVAFDTTAETVTPLRPLDRLVDGLAVDAQSGAIYVSSWAKPIVRIDLLTGKSEPLMTPLMDSAHYSAQLAFRDGTLFMLDRLRTLQRVDVTTHAVTEVGPLTLSGGMAVVAPEQLMIVNHTSTYEAPSLHRVDARTAAVTPLGAVSGEGLESGSGSRVGLALTAEGAPYLVAPVRPAPLEALTPHCRVVAAAVGLTGFESAPVTVIAAPRVGLGAGATQVVRSTKSNGPEILAYESYGDSAAARSTMRIETSNPDAFVCLGTYEEMLNVSIAASAKFAGIAVTTVKPGVALQVEAGFSMSGKRVHLVPYTSTGLDPSWGASPIVQLYSYTEWTMKKQPLLAGVWSGGVMSLIELDPANWSARRVTSFKDVMLSPVLAPWNPR